MPAAKEPPTFRNLITCFTDFLTVAIHVILYERGIYPQTSFISARKYNIPVRQNRHPKVCEWINDAVNAVEIELRKGAVDRLAMVIFDKHMKPQERFTFDVSRFPTVPLEDMDIPLERYNDDGKKVKILPLVNMEEQFRATLHRLSTCSAGLKPLPSACTFSLAIELKGEAKAPLHHPQPWVPAESQSDDDASVASQTTPVRSVSAGEMRFETWIEEADGKQSADSLTIVKCPSTRPRVDNAT